jgi:hypothetical protein
MLLHKVTANGLQLLQGQLLLLLLQCLLQGLLLLLSFHLDNASWCGLWLSCMQICAAAAAGCQQVGLRQKSQALQAAAGAAGPAERP